MSVQCPQCGNSVSDLIPVDAGMRLALRAAGAAQLASQSICESCFAQMSSQMSQGMRLRLEKEAKEKNRVVLWKSRVNLIKQARQLMTQKAFSEAAMTYEKYLRILEIIFEVPKGDLSPAVFSNDPRSKELTVVTSVYWDLMRIYDSSTRHAERMNKTAIKCAEFARFSPLFPDIVKKAEAFQHSAKNPAAVRSFLIAANSSRPRCFIATEVFGPASPEVQTLRRFRDDILRLTPIGRQLVVIYYRHSPTIARALRASAIARASVRPFLRLIAAAVSFLLKR